MATHKPRYQCIIGHYGTVVSADEHVPEIGVMIDDSKNSQSTKGIYWFKKYQVRLVDKYEEKNGGVIMEGNFKVAVVNLVNDCYKKEYGFALFEEAVVGDFAVVDSVNTFTLGKIIRIVDKTDFQPVAKEVVGVVSMATYEARKAERHRLAKIAIEKRQIQKELEARIAKVKDLAYYEKCAQELAEVDPELATLVNKLKELGA